MAIVQNPIIGRSSGMVGGLYFSKWKSYNRLSGNPLQPAYEPSDLQDIQRQKIFILGQLYRYFRPAILIGHKQHARNNTPCSSFQHHAYDNGTLVVSGYEVTSDPLYYPLAIGNINQQNGLQISWYLPSRLITVSWPDPVQGNQRADDKNICVAFNVSENKVYYPINGSVRSGSLNQFTIPDDWAVNTIVAVYTFFRRADGSACSPSVCLPVFLTG